MSRRRSLGWLNMHGRRSEMLRCRCCTAYDHREKELRKQHWREMRQRWD
jgi:hypothetical protein